MVIVYCVYIDLLLLYVVFIQGCSFYITHWCLICSLNTKQPCGIKITQNKITAFDRNSHSDQQCHN